MSHEDIIETIRKKYERVSAVLDERGRRMWALAEAEALGYAGQSLVAKATGLSRMTLYSEKVGRMQEDPARSRERVRKAGGGRRKLTAREPTLLSALEGLVEPTNPGRPGESITLDLPGYSSTGGGP